MRDRFEAWLGAGGTIRIVPAGAFAVAVLLGIIPMWLEFGAFPRWAPRERIGTPLLLAWIAIFLLTEGGRQYWARRGARRWEEQLTELELERANRLAGAIDRLCAALVPDGRGRLASGHIQAALLDGIVETIRTWANVGAEIRLHASLLVPETRREGRRQVRTLKVVSTNRLAEHRGWVSYRLDTSGPAQDTWRDGKARAVEDTLAEEVRDRFSSRSFRCILTLPVSLRCVGGQPLAIVSIDAARPGIFRESPLLVRLEQAAAPQMKLLALSLVLAGREP